MADLTFDIAVDGDDGEGFLSKATWPVSGGTFGTAWAGETFGMTGRSLEGATYYVWNTCLRFDTSSIPDSATVSAAVLKLYLTSAFITNAGLNLLGDYYDYGGSPAVLADVTLGEEATAFTQAVSFYDTAGTIFNTSLTGLASISKTGYTGIRLKWSQRAADAAPTGGNHLHFAMREHATAAAPQLVVTYSVSGGGHLQLATIGAG